MKHQYICKKCGNHSTLPIGSKFCPLCGGNVESKTEVYAMQKSQELQELLPILHQKYNDFAETYVKFKKVNETLRTYASRGIIPRDMVVDFKPEGLTTLFYKGRKSRK